VLAWLRQSAVAWFAAAALVCSAAASLAYGLRPPRPPRGDFPLAGAITAWSGWDGEWYERIARDGYYYLGTAHQSPVAFFPGYPLAIRALAAAGVNTWVAGVLLTLAAGAAAAVLFRRWARRVSGDPDAARWATALLLVYPFAFYLYGAMYSDALFLALALAAFVHLEEGRVGWAAAFGALATATRPVAPALVLGLLARRLELRRREGRALSPSDALLLLAAGGMAAYVLYLGLRFGEPLAFAHVQAAPGWDQPPGPHTWLKVTWWETVSDTRSRTVALRFIGHAYLTLFWLLLAIPTRRLLGWGYALYLAAVMGLPALSSKDFMGLGRYALAGFPAFLTLALLLKGRPRLRLGWAAVSAGILLALAWAFGGGAYVA
jgi:hypothetical protein